MSESSNLKAPTKEQMLAANVNPQTGLATDYLNIFNEYIMLAQLVKSGSMERDILLEWQPIDYCSHFKHSGFVGADIVENSYLSLPDKKKQEFIQATDNLIILICEHQSQDNPPAEMLNLMEHQRDIVASLITPPKDIEHIENVETQAQIDALFD